MNVIVCLDDNEGMSFFCRRQSMDSVLRSQARLLAADAPLWMNEYSAKQFAQDAVPVVVDPDFLCNAPEQAWCFVENVDIVPHLDRIGKIGVYRWNRLYPSDRKFPTELLAGRWQLLSSRTFAGSSHDTITEEVYQL